MIDDKLTKIAENNYPRDEYFGYWRLIHIACKTCDFVSEEEVLEWWLNKYKKTSPEAACLFALDAAGGVLY